MPVTKSAEKKMRRDEHKRMVNLRVRRRYKKALKKAEEDPAQENINKAYSMVDMAAKKRVIHKNKAARLKSRLIKNNKQ